MNPFKNFVVNLTATGSWAFLSVLAVCVTALGFAPAGALAQKAMDTLTIILCLSAGALALRPRD